MRTERCRDARLEDWEESRGPSGEPERIGMARRGEKAPLEGRKGWGVLPGGPQVGS